MKLDFSIAITTAILSALWIIVATLLNLPSWAGFLGCTTFFAFNDNRVKALFTCAFSLASGATWACMSLAIINLSKGSLCILFIATGAMAILRCIQARLKYVSFIPGAFIGSCTIFSNTEHIFESLIALFIGLFSGFLMNYSGIYLHRMTTSEHPPA